MLSDPEIRERAERICKSRDADPSDGLAMLHQIAQDHGRAAALAATEMCRIISQLRYAEARAVFEGLPPMSFGSALRIKRERGDPVAEGWTKDGNVYAKLVRAL